MLLRSASHVECEIADVVAYLATRGSYITGSVIHVNGGMYGG